MRTVYKAGGPVAVRVLVEVFVPDDAEDRDYAAREAVREGEFVVVEILEVEDGR